MSQGYKVSLTAYLEGDEDHKVDLTYIPETLESRFCQAQELLSRILKKLHVKYRPQNCFKLMLVGHKGESKMLNNRKGFKEQLASESGAGPIEICVCYTGELSTIDTTARDDIFEESVQLDSSKYTKGKEIGRGRDGVVFHGTDSDNNNVALKELQKFDPDDITKIHRLINEIKVMKTSKHPAIMPLIGVIMPGPDWKYPTIVTPLMNYSIQDWIDRKNGVVLRPQLIYIVLYGIASAMMYLHAHNITHRDLKPANVLIDDNNHPMVTDFGLAKVNHAAHSIQMSASCGTLAYMAPEAFSDLYSRQTDVYSYGILMWAMLARANPFEGCASDPLAHRNAVQSNKRPEKPANGYCSVASDGLLRLMERCWDMDSQKRPTFEEIVKDLESDECLKPQNRELFEQYKQSVEEWLHAQEEATPVVGEHASQPLEGMTQKELHSYCADGKAEALIEFGRRYELGTNDGDIEPDLTMAWRYYRKAAKVGSGDGYFCLGRCYQYGIGVPKDQVAAEALYERAAALNSPLLASRSQE